MKRRRRLRKQIENKIAWEELGISNDFLFSKVMQDSELCKGLLERILPDLEIDHIEYPQLQKEIKQDADAKSVRLDVYVRDGKGTVYDIEMQVVDTKELPKRSRYYQSMVDLQMLDKGQHYKYLKPAYIIFICQTDIFGRGRHIYTFENICKEDKHISLEDGMTKIFLNSKGDQEDVRKELKVFLDYVAGKESEDLFVRKLMKAVEQAKRNREWRHEYMTLLMRDQENFEKGIEQGIEQGIEKGIEQGIEQGMIVMIENALLTTGSVEQTARILKIDREKVREVASHKGILIAD
ncbi:MAG: Rpn family recombination-promoting nuclease/putative transposase [Lachnospiraceae bacterium]|nr:Rpn family recombination-promoting nuclease/putative transposase [Lachnospiraceae bacterium]